jgi:hypothetical protein
VTLLLAVSVVGIGSIIVNVLIASLVVKLYTEYFKDRSASRRRDS